MVAGRVRDAIQCEEARMSRYGSTKSVSHVRKWRSRPRGVDLSVIWRLIFARNVADSKSDWLLIRKQIGLKLTSRVTKP